METVERTHNPVIAALETPVLVAANMPGPPDGFDPERDGATLWLKMRMRLHSPEAE